MYSPITSCIFAVLKPRYIRPCCTRSYSSEPTQTEAELNIYKKLNSALNPNELKVKDVSGGCGSMYELHIKSSKFNGLNKVHQQRLVNQVLKEEISKWHGVRMTTVPTE